MKRSKTKVGKTARTGGPTPRSGKERGLPAPTGEEAHLQWARKNYLLLGLGALVIVIGFLLLGLGDTTIAPLLLVGGYLVLIPWGIVASRKKSGPAGVGGSP
jgi:hypothetical protein